MQNKANRWSVVSSQWEERGQRSAPALQTVVLRVLGVFARSGLLPFSHGSRISRLKRWESVVTWRSLSWLFFGYHAFHCGWRPGRGLGGEVRAKQRQFRGPPGGRRRPAVQNKANWGGDRRMVKCRLEHGLWENRADNASAKTKPISSPKIHHGDTETPEIIPSPASVSLR
jgi:hypothetical protein